MLDLRSRVAGALFGCAVGDAMGAPFEGLWTDSIPPIESLLAGYHEYDGFPTGQYTDDTQLSIATVESIVECKGVNLHGIATRISSLWWNHSVIGPGGACTQAAETFLATSDWSAMGAPVGQAGNGTAMRTAVAGLWYVQQPEKLADEVAAISRLTHRDPRSVAGGVAIAEAARILATNDSTLEPELFCQSIAEKIAPIEADFGELIRILPVTGKSDNAFERIAFAGQDHPEFDQPIITPYVVPTVLAAIHCVLKHPDSWSNAVTETIRLGGDVDTLGAIVGALAGIRNGFEEIPQNLVEGVQRSDHLRLLATRYYDTIVEQNQSKASHDGRR